MKFLTEYIGDYSSEPRTSPLAQFLDDAKHSYDFLLGGNAKAGQRWPQGG